MPTHESEVDIGQATMMLLVEKYICFLGRVVSLLISRIDVFIESLIKVNKIGLCLMFVLRFNTMKLPEFSQFEFNQNAVIFGEKWAHERHF